MMQIQLHWYGFIVGIAIVTAFELVQKKAKIENISQNRLLEAGVVTLFFGVVGARAWHIITDYWLYIDNFQAIFFIWNGGLSILGGVLGGLIGLQIYLQFLKSTQKITLSLATLLDISIFGLPVGQAIGRLANYVNHELYGLPTNGFFKIYISEEHRMAGYESVSYYHPLFLYESIFTASFALFLYFFDKKNKLPKIGSGVLFLSYIFYYSVVRFFLDFLRISRGILVADVLGINQVILLMVIFAVLFFGMFKCMKK